MTAKTPATAKETKITTVTMQDGRVVDFPGKRRLQKTSEISDTGVITVRLDFLNGTTTLFTVPENLLHRFAAHGAEQKLGDEIAGLTEIDDCVLAIDELIDRLYNGDWSVKRESSGMAGTSVLVRALVEHTAQSNYSWHTPGHGGGVAYRKSPVGQAFHQFFGENTLRSDLSVSVPELGSLLDHTGPLAEAEDLVRRFAAWRQQPHPGVRWGLERRADGVLVGSCGLFAWNPGWAKCSTGYELAGP